MNLIPIVSVYGRGGDHTIAGKQIDPTILQQLDALIYDIQDSGMRHYTYYNLANLYFKQDDFNKAVEYSLYSIQHKPNFVLPHLTMGGSYYRLGEFEKARASFNRTLAIEPSNEEAKNFLNKLDKEKRLPNQKTD